MSSGRNELVFELGSRATAKALVEFVGRELRFLHNLMGRTYVSLAEETGVPASTLSRLARGRSRYPRLESVLPVLGSLDLEYDPKRRAIVRSSNVTPLRQSG